MSERSKTLKYIDVESALKKIDRVNQFLGTDYLNRQVENLTGYQYPERAKRAVALGDRREFIREYLNENARPKLIAIKDETASLSKLEINVQEGLFDIDFKKLPPLTKLQRKLVEVLRFATKEQPSTNDDQLLSLYNGERSEIHALQQVRKKTAKKLAESGISISNLRSAHSRLGGLYYLERAETTEPTVEEPAKEMSFEQAKAILTANILELESLSANDPIMEAALQDTRQALIDLIDRQSAQITETETSAKAEEEKIHTIDLTLKHSNGIRTDEETAVLAALASYLISHENLHWEVLHQDIATFLKTNVSRYSESQFIEMLKPGVVNNIFVKAINKMFEENQIQAQRATWSKTERQLWENVQKMQRELGGGRQAQLKDKISHKLTNAFNEFINRDPDSRNVSSFQIRTE